MNKRAIEAKGDDAKRELFIRDMEKTILKHASKASGRFITTSDDEWSIALIAFNKAIDTYSPDKGDYAGYSKVLIERALIDHHRSQSKHESEVLYSTDMLEGEEYSAVTDALSRESMAEEEKRLVRTGMQDEIEEVNGMLKKYGFSFYDVAGCSPKSGKTREECRRVIAYIIEDDEILRSVTDNGKIPITKLTKKIKVSPFLLDRHRKYLVMAVVILNGEYPMLAEYLRDIRKETDS